MVSGLFIMMVVETTNRTPKLRIELRQIIYGDYLPGIGDHWSGAWKERDLYSPAAVCHVCFADFVQIFVTWNMRGHHSGCEVYQ